MMKFAPLWSRFLLLAVLLLAVGLAVAQLAPRPSLTLAMLQQANCQNDASGRPINGFADPTTVESLGQRFDLGPGFHSFVSASYVDTALTYFQYDCLIFVYDDRASAARFVDHWCADDSRRTEPFLEAEQGCQITTIPYTVMLRQGNLVMNIRTDMGPGVAERIANDVLGRVRTLEKRYETLPG
ncbi:MAG: hypothetical protein H6651_15245 [Ardenticatenales bacterium]|nr:hypothetical protein [Ardenticatenales bacterium]